MSGETVKGEGEIIHTFGCGCQADQATGLPVHTCRRHDQRTREVKASAALQDLGNWLDEAAKELRSDGLVNAAKAAVKAAKALIGSE